MHVIFRESHGLGETATPTDLGQTPAEMVVLSFSDSDLGAFAAAWHRAAVAGAGDGPSDGGLPALRLANLAALTHPLSVDTYVERTLVGARAILIRLIGGLSYWDYGVQQVRALAQERGIALAVLPADGRADARLDAQSTLPVPVLRRLARLCDQGGVDAAHAALSVLAQAAGLTAPTARAPEPLPMMGAYAPGRGVYDPSGDVPVMQDGGADGLAGAYTGAQSAEGQANAPADNDEAATAYADAVPVAAVSAAALPNSAGPVAPALKPASPAADAPIIAAHMSKVGEPAPAANSPTDCPRIVLTFYRSYLAAADTAPVDALIRAFEAAGNVVLALFAPSLKEPEAAAWLAGRIAAFAPDAIVNATAFSGRGADGASPLDVGGVPVFQVALATSTRAAWAQSDRGLSPADLAMHVVLPEVDGRILAGVVSFKQPAARDPQLQFARHLHQPDDGRIAAVVARVQGWVRLARIAPRARRLALVMSTYPGKDWNMGHAVGLDTMASLRAMADDLAAAGHDLGGSPAGPPPGLSSDTPDASSLTSTSPAHLVDLPADLPAALAARAIEWPLKDYLRALDGLPAALREALAAVWGAPQGDPDCDGQVFRFAALRAGRAIIALQPERGDPARRGDDYHDLARVPRHAYVAFYLWLQSQADALVHIGAHGTLEWLPGKSVALSDACWPEVLTGALPVIYPFIVNDPGEAAQARRRIGAVTLGHLPPPLRVSGTPDRLTRLESLLDEFSSADGLDPRRRDRLQGDIRAEAQALGVEDDLGLDHAATAAEAIARIDRFVCDVKDSQFGHGLHVWGRAPEDGPQTLFDAGPSAAAERRSLPDALAGRRIAAGPAGSPYRGRADVLPTGRNIYATDPRAVPTRAAYAQGVRLADELIRRHLQDHGDWPRHLIVDLWGSATMRTAGEEFGMALHLTGCRPVWDAGADRVSGVEVLTLAELGRPRTDVTLRVSGLFRDVFPTLTALFQHAVRVLAARDEAPDWNPYVGRAPDARVYGPAPGSYGLGMGAALDDYSDEGRRAAGEAWLSASAWALDGDAARRDPAGLRARVAAAQGFAHPQDLPETDVLLAADYAAHEGGFAAAQAITGGDAALYHLDNTDPARPRVRALTEEIARVVQARATHPGWLSGMRAHGFRGAAEIALTLDHMAAFAHLAGVVGPHLFDVYFDATLGDPGVVAFMQDANPGALDAMRARFAALDGAGLWVTRRNSIRAGMGE